MHFLKEDNATLTLASGGQSSEKNRLGQDCRNRSAWDRARRVGPALVYSRVRPLTSSPPRTRSVFLAENTSRSQRESGATSRASTPPPLDTPETGSNTQELTRQLYDELCAIAHRLRRAERDEHTLQTTALVHEAFLRLAQQHAAAWQSRPYFLAAAAQTMRRVLVDYARERSAAKRDAGLRTTMISVPDARGIEGDTLDVLALDDVLSRLAALNERKARVVELRVFGGFDIDEIAAVIGVSRNTVKRDWQFAKAWLACQLTETK